MLCILAMTWSENICLSLEQRDYFIFIFVRDYLFKKDLCSRYKLRLKVVVNNASGLCEVRYPDLTIKQEEGEPVSPSCHFL